ncbi:MAG: peptide chain release factor 2 [Clostridia bacterium]|nr:peptide chain release factor 2 [Clostridia bacterium]
MIENFQEQFGEISQKFASISGALGKEKLLLQLEDLNLKLMDPAIYSDIEKSKTISKNKARIETSLAKINQVEKAVDDFAVAIEFVKSGETGMLAELENLSKIAEKAVNELYLETLYAGEYDNEDVLLEIHSGAGGEEAQDWCDMLSRMYVKYAGKMGYEITITDKLPGDGAGYKSISFVVSGQHCYGNLKCERGVHRLVRISPFDSNARRHTSFASVEVSPILSDDTKIEVNPADLKIDTYRSSGAGGQHVNKTESAVRITHIPTGIVVACQNERSQVQNKEQAMKMLKAKLTSLEEQRKEKEKLENLATQKKIEWGSQIRSYVLHPYNMVKDHRTNVQTSDTGSVLDGNIQDFIIEYLKTSN